VFLQPVGLQGVRICPGIPIYRYIMLPR
jgi:hypothetical protein